jgi:hypothetical protein
MPRYVTSAFGHEVYELAGNVDFPNEFLALDEWEDALMGLGRGDHLVLVDVFREIAFAS